MAEQQQEVDGGAAARRSGAGVGLSVEQGKQSFWRLERPWTSGARCHREEARPLWRVERVMVGLDHVEEAVAERAGGAGRGHTRAHRGTREVGGHRRKLARGHGEEAEALGTAAADVILEHPSRRMRQGHTQAAGMDSVGGDAGQQATCGA